VNSFKNKFYIKKNKLLSFYDHCEFDKNKITYTIMGSGNNNTMSLIKDIEYHRINYYFINITYYNYDDIINICNRYNIKHNSDVYDKPLIFGKNKFIGGSFELYQEIIKY
jgi:hypothetical protein